MTRTAMAPDGAAQAFDIGRGEVVQALRMTANQTTFIIPRRIAGEKNRFFKDRSSLMKKVKMVGKNFIVFALPNEEFDTNSFELITGCFRPKKYAQIGADHIGQIVDSNSLDKSYKLVSSIIHNLRSGSVASKRKVVNGNNVTVTTSLGMELSVSNAVGRPSPDAGALKVDHTEVANGLWVVHKRELEPIPEPEVMTMVAGIVGFAAAA